MKERSFNQKAITYTAFFAIVATIIGVAVGIFSQGKTPVSFATGAGTNPVDLQVVSKTPDDGVVTAWIEDSNSMKRIVARNLTTIANPATGQLPLDDGYSPRVSLIFSGTDGVPFDLRTIPLADGKTFLMWSVDLASSSDVAIRASLIDASGALVAGWSADGNTLASGEVVLNDTAVFIDNAAEAGILYSYEDVAAGISSIKGNLVSLTGTLFLPTDMIVATSADYNFSNSRLIYSQPYGVYLTYEGKSTVTPTDPRHVYISLVENGGSGIIFPWNVDGYGFLVSDPAVDSFNPQGAVSSRGTFVDWKALPASSADIGIYGQLVRNDELANPTADTDTDNDPYIYAPAGGAKVPGTDLKTTQLGDIINFISDSDLVLVAPVDNAKKIDRITFGEQGAITIATVFPDRGLGYSYGNMAKVVSPDPLVTNVAVMAQLIHSSGKVGLSAKVFKLNKPIDYPDVDFTIPGNTFLPGLAYKNSAALAGNAGEILVSGLEGNNNSGAKQVGIYVVSQIPSSVFASNNHWLREALAAVVQTDVIANLGNGVFINSDANKPTLVFKPVFDQPNDWGANMAPQMLPGDQSALNYWRGVSNVNGEALWESNWEPSGQIYWTPVMNASKIRSFIGKGTSGEPFVLALPGVSGPKGVVEAYEEFDYANPGKKNIFVKYFDDNGNQIFKSGMIDGSILFATDTDGIDDGRIFTSTEGNIVGLLFGKQVDGTRKLFFQAILDNTLALPSPMAADNDSNFDEKHGKFSASDGTLHVALDQAGTSGTEVRAILFDADGGLSIIYAETLGNGHHPLIASLATADHAFVLYKKNASGPSNEPGSVLKRITNAASPTITSVDLTDTKQGETDVLLQSPDNGNPIVAAVNAAQSQVMAYVYSNALVLENSLSVSGPAQTGPLNSLRFVFKMGSTFGVNLAWRSGTNIIILQEVGDGGSLKYGTVATPYGVAAITPSSGENFMHPRNSILGFDEGMAIEFANAVSGNNYINIWSSGDADTVGDEAPGLSGVKSTGAKETNFIDTDNDGFYDEVDACPTVPGIAPDGCPSGDSDDDGINDDVDQCPTVVGVAPTGCPYWKNFEVSVKTLCMKDKTYCGGKGEKNEPVVGAEVTIYNNTIFGTSIQTGPTCTSGLITLSKSNLVSNYANVLNCAPSSFKLGMALTDSNGLVTVGSPIAAEGIAIIEATDTMVDPDTTVYTSQAVNVNNLAQDTAHPQYLRVLKSGVAQIMTGGKTATMTGSLLTILYPENAQWEEGLTTYVYPYVFTSDSAWDVDICTFVPQGYKVAGTYDDAGNLIKTNSCTQTFVNGETRIIAFEVVDIGSPKKFNFSATVKAKRENKGQNADLTTATEKVPKGQARKAARGGFGR